MLVLQCHIEITNKDTQNILKFDYVNSISVKTSIGTLTDTATVVVPRKVKWRGQALDTYIKIGDTIAISLGYKESGLQPVFSGFITSVSSVSPITLTCEDSMYTLKTTDVKPCRYPKFDLKKFLGQYVPQVKVEIPEEISFGEVIIEAETSVAKVIDYLIQNYPFRCFFSGGILYCILLTAKISVGSKEHLFRIGENTISDTLKYVKAEDVKLIIKAKSIVNGKKKLEVQSPKDSKEGEVRTFYAPSCKTEKDLQDFADNKLAQYKNDKMTGNVSLFGVPFVQKGEKVKLKDVLNGERNDKRFVVESVHYTFGAGGYRQEISLGDQIQ
ncbi:MAG: hypothetical protein RR386_08815 [Bacteroidaceae bacterium]